MAHFVCQIVSFFGPKVLMSLSFGPTARASAAAEEIQNRRLPNVETLAVHEAALRAVLVIANHFGNVANVVQWNAMARRLQTAARCATHGNAAIYRRRIGIQIRRTVAPLRHFNFKFQENVEFFVWHWTKRTGDDFDLTNRIRWWLSTNKRRT